MSTNELRVNLARMVDYLPWLDLASEVENLFGPMISEENFHRALKKNIKRGSAYCVRDGDGFPGNPLIGGLLFSMHPPLYEIGWLAVTKEFRRMGVGELLVKYALKHVQIPAIVKVVTFGEDHSGGIPARNFYRKMGFLPCESVPTGSGGCLRQVFYRKFG